MDCSNMPSEVKTVGCDFGGKHKDYTAVAVIDGMTHSVAQSILMAPPIMGSFSWPVISNEPTSLPGLIEEQLAARMNVTVDKYRRILAYAKGLRSKHPNYSPSRIQRKVCEHFKIKLT